jgi:hypothetical protein
VLVDDLGVLLEVIAVYSGTDDMRLFRSHCCLPRLVSTNVIFRATNLLLSQQYSSVEGRNDPCNWRTRDDAYQGELEDVQLSHQLLELAQKN